MINNKTIEELRQQVLKEVIDDDNKKKVIMNGTIYALYSQENILLYIGSTFNLKRRVADHKTRFLNKNNSHYNYPIYKYIREKNWQWIDIRIAIIAQIKLFGKNEIECKYFLHDVENTFIKIKCPLCNKCFACLSKRERKEYQKQYNAKYFTTIVKCPCGKIYKGKQHKSRHEKTKKHQKYLTNLNNTASFYD